MEMEKKNPHQKYFDYLERLRESGETNMLGAVPYLQRKFPELGFDRARAREIHRAWMDSYKEDIQIYAFCRRIAQVRFADPEFPDSCFWRSRSS